LFSPTAYLFGERTVTMVSPDTSPAVNTAPGIFALGVGLLGRCVEAGPMAIFVAEDSGGDSLRKLLPVSVAVMVFSGFVSGLGVRGGLYSFDGAMVIFAVVAAVVLAVTIWSDSGTWSRSDAERRRDIERFLQRSNARSLRLVNQIRYASNTNRLGVLKVREPMIFTRLQAHRFRCLEQVDQRLDRFQALVGPNASGKTTFLDVFGLFGDLMRYRGDIQEAVGRRGADFFKLLWKGRGSSFQVALEAKIPDEIREKMRSERQILDRVRYEVEVNLDAETNEIGLDREILWLFTEQQTASQAMRSLFPDLYTEVGSIFWKKTRGRSFAIRKKIGGNDNFYPENSKSYRPSYRLGRLRSALANVPADSTNFSVALWFKAQLEDGVQNFILDSQTIRQPSPPGSGNRFQTNGSNLPWVIHELRKDARQFSRWLAHVRTALEDIRDIQTVERPEDRHRYLVVEYDNGSSVPSWLVSDGTLRLLALTIPAYIKDLQGVFLIEEPENGIHPKAMETVTQSLTSIYRSQVLIATHSPIVINQLESNQIVCFAKNADGATDTVSGDLHPRLKDWKRGKPDLGVLAASGILS